MQQQVTRLLLLAALGAALAQCVAAGQGCPFEDGSCQTYCNQQGCNFGYCGHFAWIQCICRKCGDEWNWYDKVHYRADKQVNQTELDSLKLNGSAPIIITSKQSERAPTGSAANAAAAATKAATLTTLLIPDLSDSSKLDLNDIPDENSEKFLDFLAKNHEKLAQATGKQQAPSGGNTDPTNESDDETDEQQEPQAEETVEIQISSSNNQRPATTEDGELEAERQPASAGQVERLLRMALHERLAEELS